MQQPASTAEPLLAYLQGLLDQADGHALYRRYQEDLSRVTPQLLFEAFYRLYASGVTADSLLAILDKVINVVHRSLVNRPWPKPEPGSFLDLLRLENRGLLDRLDGMRKILTDRPVDARRQLLACTEELQLFHAHYQKKENILFPYLEKKMDRYRGLAIMWALHDVIRQRMKRAIVCLQDEQCPEQDCITALGQLIFGMHGMVNKEEWILFPVACDMIETHEWQAMAKQSMEYAFPFVEQPPAWSDNAAGDLADDAGLNAAIPRAPGLAAETFYQSETGTLSPDQITQVFAALPADLTVVDQDNRVVYFTRPKDRIFARSPAIIGRRVEDCHPPHSVNKVLDIIDTFRSGSRSEATFWINLHGKLILIQYFALRDTSGHYQGTLEVSQEITHWQRIEGEKRLVDWQD